MDRSESIATIALALSKAQAAIEPAPKDSLNPHFKRKYADLTSVWEVCRGPLAENGLAIVQTPEPSTEGGIALRTLLIHTSGEWIGSTTPLLFDHASMQSLGSAITYARRYALSAMVGVVSDTDDDAEGAGQAPPRHQAAPARSQQPQGRQQSNGHAGGERRAYDGPDKPPTTGRALFAVAKKLGEETGDDVAGWLMAWGKKHDVRGKVVDWEGQAVPDAHAAMMARFAAPVGAPADEPESAYGDQAPY